MKHNVSQIFVRANKGDTSLRKGTHCCHCREPITDKEYEVRIWKTEQMSASAYSYYHVGCGGTKALRKNQAEFAKWVKKAAKNNWANSDNGDVACKLDFGPFTALLFTEHEYDNFTTIHHELQKARVDWFIEESVKRLAEMASTWPEIYLSIIVYGGGLPNLCFHVTGGLYATQPNYCDPAVIVNVLQKRKSKRRM